MKEIDMRILNPKSGKEEHILAKRIGGKDWFIQANPFSGNSGEILNYYFENLEFVERANQLCDDKACRGYIYRERS